MTWATCVGANALHTLQVRVFQDMDEARAWVEQPDDGDGDHEGKPGRA